MRGDFWRIPPPRYTAQHGAPANSLTLRRLMDTIERFAEEERANPVATSARASMPTLALLRSRVPPASRTVAGSLAGVLLYADETVPPKVVRFYDRRGDLLREITLD